MGKHPAWLGKAMQSGGGAWSGEGDTGKYLRDKASSEKMQAKKSFNNATKDATTAVVGGMVSDFAKGKIGRGIGKAITGIGSVVGGVDAVDAAKHYSKGRQAADLAEDAEGRKRGGRTNAGRRK